MAKIYLNNKKVYLDRASQFITLKNTGTVTLDSGAVVTYSDKDTYFVPEGTIIDIGNGQATIDTLIFPTISVSVANEIYEAYSNGVSPVLYWDLVGEMLFSVLGADKVAQSETVNNYELVAMVHEKTIVYNWTSESTGDLTPTVKKVVEPPTSTSSFNRVLHNASGTTNTSWQYSSNSAQGNTYAIRTANGRLKAVTPTENDDLTTKLYVDNIIKEVVDVGSYQYSYDSTVLPAIKVEKCQEIYDKHKSGKMLVIKWTILGTETYLSVVSADTISGTYSLDVLVHNKYHCAYSWTANTAEGTTLNPEVEGGENVTKSMFSLSGTTLTITTT